MTGILLDELGTDGVAGAGGLAIVEVLDHGRLARGGAERHAASRRLEPGRIECGVGQRKAGCGNRQLRRPRDRPRTQPFHEAARIEVLDLAADVHGEALRVERLHGTDAALACQDGAPERLHPDADRCHDADARHHHAWTGFHFAD